MIEFNLINFFVIISAVFCLGVITPLALFYVVIRREDRGRKTRKQQFD